MADELFPDESGDEYEYEDEEEDSGPGIIEKLREKIQDALDRGDAEEEETEESSSTSGLGLTDEDEEDGPESIINELDRFSYLLLGVEALLVVYLILALLGLVPFF